ncbi:hypothetical protein EIK77_000518 [Talaromyces pinophilus]|nr:hypothetical protein EIK77_000518 [Talaromyces pinophilus]
MESRLSLPCNYEDAEAAVPVADTQSQFRSVFDRLERLEELVLPSREREAATSSIPKFFATRTRTDVLDAEKWQISPRLLDPSYLEVIASANVIKILEERGLTVQEVGRLYFSTIYNFMPILSKENFDRRVREVESFSPHGHFLILILAIILLTENPTNAGPAASPASLASQPTSYRVCKYHFSLFTSFKDPSIELIQAGLCIALYEHEQCVSDQAYLTIGTCARMARLLRLYSTDHASESGCDQDFLNVTMAIQLLDMYFAPPSIR